MSKLRMPSLSDPMNFSLSSQVRVAFKASELYTARLIPPRIHSREYLGEFGAYAIHLLRADYYKSYFHRIVGIDVGSPSKVLELGNCQYIDSIRTAISH